MADPTGRPDAAALSGPFLVNVGLYNVPPNARQPGTSQVIDTLDAALAARLSSLGLRVEVVNTIMQSLADKASLARTALTLARMDAHDLCRDSR